MCFCRCQGVLQSKFAGVRGKKRTRASPVRTMHAATSPVGCSICFVLHSNTHYAAGCCIPTFQPLSLLCWPCSCNVLPSVHLSSCDSSCCFCACVRHMQGGQEVPDDVLVPLMVLGMVEASNYAPPVVEVGWQRKNLRHEWYPTILLPISLLCQVLLLSMWP